VKGKRLQEVNYGMGIIDMFNTIDTQLITVLGIIYIAWQMYKAKK
jgi:hypothetical protein